MFERREDIRFFLARVAWMVHRGLIEVHAYSLLTTHFHMLIRSLRGDLGFAMCRIQSEYSSRFNRKRNRDGPLVRSRYATRLVGSDVYRDNVIRYIDKNAVDAGLVAKPEWHGASSAYWYGSDRRSPRWLERGWIENRVRARCGGEFSAAAYLECFRPELSADHEAWILRRLAAGEGAPDPLDDLIDAAPPKVRAWLQRNAEHADGERAVIALAPALALDSACLAVAPAFLAAQHALGRRRANATPLMMLARAGVLCDVAGLTLREAASRLERSESSVHHWVHRHRDLLLGNAAYAALVAECVLSALQELR
jgi:hypothetical protein